jgi:uncharacterized protein YukE
MLPKPDVDAMVAVAATMRQRADTLGSVSFRLDAQVKAMLYAGPAADQFRSNMTERRQRLAKVIAELQSTADTVTRAAVTQAAMAPTTGSTR